MNVSGVPVRFPAASFGVRTWIASTPSARLLEAQMGGLAEARPWGKTHEGPSQPSG